MRQHWKGHCWCNFTLEMSKQRLQKPRTPLSCSLSYRLPEPHAQRPHTQYTPLLINAVALSPLFSPTRIIRALCSFSLPRSVLVSHFISSALNTSREMDGSHRDMSYFIYFFLCLVFWKALFSSLVITLCSSVCPKPPLPSCGQRGPDSF